MSGARLRWPGSMTLSLLAALTVWVSLWSWAGFVERPGSYLGPALVAVLVVAGSGVLLRAARVPALLVVPVQLVVLSVWFTHRWAPESALVGWLPTNASVQAVLDVLSQSVASAQAYVAPVPADAPSIAPLLVLAASVIAVLVDLLACGIRRVPVAGLPLLAVYTAPVSILDSGVPWWVFAAGAASFLWLLTSDESRRLVHWGRPVGRSESVLLDSVGAEPSAASMRSSARKIGLTATGFAVVAPLVIPTLGDGLLPGGGPGSGGDGESVSISNPIVDLRRDLARGEDVELLAVRTAEGDPRYLRISVLDTFNGETWRPSSREIPPEQQANGSIPPPPGLTSQVDRREVDFQISVGESFSSAWLPTPYPVSSIDVPGDWRYDTETLDFISAEEGQTTAGIDYALTALEVRPSTEELLDAGASPEAIYTPYTELPDEFPESVTELTADLTDGLETGFEKAVRLQRWFREDGNFRYSLRRAPGNGTEDLIAFLAAGPEGRVGYCEQFAGAMAVMGRTIGIPSRVAVGFLRPEEVSEDTYVFSAHDLHAWPEMYFDDIGWVRFEPTPARRARSVPDYTTGSFDTPEPTALPSASAPAQQQDQAQRKLRETDLGAPAPGGGGSGSGGLWTGLLVVVLLGGLVLAPRLLRGMLQRRRWSVARTPADVAEAGWRELRDTALDLRLPWDDAVTLRIRAHSLSTAFGRTAPTERQGARQLRRGLRGAHMNPEAVEALARLVRDVELARYSRGHGQTSGRSRQEVEADVDTCTQALRAGASARQRRSARWLPASLLRNGAWRSLRDARASGGITLTEPGVDGAG